MRTSLFGWQLVLLLTVTGMRTFLSQLFRTSLLLFHHGSQGMIIYIYIHIYTHINIYVYKYTHIHTYIYIYTYESVANVTELSICRGKLLLRSPGPQISGTCRLFGSVHTCRSEVGLERFRVLGFRVTSEGQAPVPVSDWHQAGPTGKNICSIHCPHFVSRPLQQPTVSFNSGVG